MDGTKRPYLAALLGVFVPGLGHVYSGRYKAAIKCFLVVTLPFALGLYLAGNRIFAFSNHPLPAGPDGQSMLSMLFGWLPLHCWPEIGNLGESALAWAFQPEMTAQYSRLLRLPLPYEQLGLTLSGLSGPLNLLLAADACWLVARDNLSRTWHQEISGRPALTALLAWLFPGLGHVYAGARGTGFMIASSMLLLYAGGLYCSEFTAVDRAQYYWWWAAQSGMGGPTLLLSPALGARMAGHDIEHIDLGITLLSLVGLLNYVSMTDAYTLAESKALGSADRGSGEAAPGSGGATLEPDA